LSNNKYCHHVLWPTVVMK